MRGQVITLSAVLLSAATSANAIVIFSDGFEGATATPDTWAQQNALAPANRTDADPVGTTGVPDSAQAGEWFQYNKSGNPIHDIAVTTNAAPGPYAGSQYLRIHRSSGSDQANIAAAITESLTPMDSGSFHAQWRMYVPDVGDSYVGGVYLVEHLDNDHGGGTGGSGPTLFFQGDGDIRISENNFGNNFFIGTPTFARGQWVLWEMDVDLDANSWTLTVNGVQSAALPFNNANAKVAGILFNGQEGQEYYVDDVQVDVIPEPASMGLLLAGGVLAAGKRNRRRCD